MCHKYILLFNGIIIIICIGVTRSNTYFRLAKTPIPMYLLDTPGIFVPNIDVNNTELIDIAMKIGICNGINEGVIGVKELADYVLYILNKKKSYGYLKFIGLDNPCDNIDTILDSLSKNASFLKKNPNIITKEFDPIKNKSEYIFDEYYASKLFLSLYQNGKLDKTILDEI